MPVFKKRRVSKAKAKKGSYAMVPRVRLNGEKAHRHIVTCSTSTEDSFFITNQTGGVSQFNIGVRSGANASFTFSLSEVIIRIQGLTALTLPVPGQQELVNLYDTFQIEKVELKIWSGATESAMGDPASGATTAVFYTMPLIGHTPDMDDANNTSITALQQYSTYRCDQLGQSKPISRSFVPCVAGNTVSGQTRLQKQDINTGFPNTPHYGFKMSVDGFHSNPGALLDTTYLSCQFRIHYLMKSTR